MITVVIYNSAYSSSLTLICLCVRGVTFAGDCCGGMISITSGPSSVIWTSLKELFDRFIEVYVWLDFEGNAFVVSKEEGMELFLNYQNV